MSQKASLPASGSCCGGGGTAARHDQHDARQGGKGFHDSCWAVSPRDDAPHRFPFFPADPNASSLMTPLASRNDCVQCLALAAPLPEQLPVGVFAGEENLLCPLVELLYPVVEEGEVLQPARALHSEVVLGPHQGPATRGLGTARNPRFVHGGIVGAEASTYHD